MLRAMRSCEGEGIFSDFSSTLAHVHGIGEEGKIMENVFRAGVGAQLFWLLRIERKCFSLYCWCSLLLLQMCLESFIKLLRGTEDGKAVLVVGEGYTQLGREIYFDPLELSKLSHPLFPISQIIMNPKRATTAVLSCVKGKWNFEPLKMSQKPARVQIIQQWLATFKLVFHQKRTKAFARVLGDCRDIKKSSACPTPLPLPAL